VFVGIGPVLGNGTAGFFFDSDQQSVVWRYWSSAAILVRHPASGDLPTIPTQRYPKPIDRGVDRSWGLQLRGREAMAVSFTGNDRSRFIGPSTEGLATANRAFEDDDGALIILATTIFADRSRTRFGGLVIPDVETSSRDADLHG